MVVDSSPPFGSHRTCARTQNHVSLPRARWPRQARACHDGRGAGHAGFGCRRVKGPAFAFTMHPHGRRADATAQTLPLGDDTLLAQTADSLIRVSRRAAAEPPERSLSKPSGWAKVRVARRTHRPTGRFREPRGPRTASHGRTPHARRGPDGNPPDHGDPRCFQGVGRTGRPVTGVRESQTCSASRARRSHVLHS